MEAGKNTNTVMANNRIVHIVRGAIVLLIICWSIGTTQAQVNIVEEKPISEIMDMYVRNNFNTPMVRAWRIQIITTNNRALMEDSIKEFEELYPDIKYKWQHNPPYYQVRIGAYEKRQDLEAFLLKLKEDFPAAIPVQDDIEKTEIIFN